MREGAPSDAAIECVRSRRRWLVADSSKRVLREVVNLATRRAAAGSTSPFSADEAELDDRDSMPMFVKR
jgi:hypothetical protein